MNHVIRRSTLILTVLTALFLSACAGGSSAALILDWLRHFGHTATLYVPDRIDEGYGPNAPAMAGKDVVGGWVAGYFDAVETAWEKTSLELVVSGDWAFERYAYTATDTPHGGGAAYTDSGNGINIYRTGDDFYLVYKSTTRYDLTYSGVSDHGLIAKFTRSFDF